MDLSSFGAIVGFGCTSAAAYRTAKGEQDIRAAEEAGMDGHIAKPIDLGTMRETITDVLRRHEA